MEELGHKQQLPSCLCSCPVLVLQISTLAETIWEQFNWQYLSTVFLHSYITVSYYVAAATVTFMSFHIAVVVMTGVHCQTVMTLTKAPQP